jgi:hypothetical protein
MTLALVYLARGVGEGLASVKCFFDAYNKYTPDYPHDLIVISKGWENQTERNELLTLAKKNKAIVYDMPDDGLDWAAYMRLAPQLKQDWLCFLNTHSRPLVKGWLRLLKVAADSNTDKFGAVGATGSLETSLPYIFARSKNYHGFQAVAIYPFRLILNVYRYITNLCYFTGFPNPHLRSNAFLVRRDLFIEYCQTQKLPRSKRDTTKLESGRNGFSSYLLAKGLRLFVTGVDGKVYEWRQWVNSFTFRTHEQQNLLVGDNQTNDYQTSAANRKAYLEFMTWGNRF